MLKRFNAMKAVLSVVTKMCSGYQSVTKFDSYLIILEASHSQLRLVYENVTSKNWYRSQRV